MNTVKQVSSITQALNWMLDEGMIQPHQKQTARKKLQYIKKGKKKSYMGIEFIFTN